MNRRDIHHAWAVEQFARLRPPLLTCEAVLSETSYLLGHGSPSALALLDLVERRVVKLELQVQTEVMRIRELEARYASVPMAFADACLVRLAELHHDATVWTTDGDFRIYRRNGRQRIRTLMPPAP